VTRPDRCRSIEAARPGLVSEEMSYGSGVTLVQVRADSSVCPRGSGHTELGDSFGAVRHVSV